MNIRFLKEISEAYVIDSGLKQSPEQIFDDLYDIVKLLQEHDVFLYNELYEATSLKQQRIFKNYLDKIYTDENIITEDGIVIPAPIILGSIVALLFGKTIAKTYYKLASTIGEAFETLGRFLARHGKYSQIRYAIIQENSRKCYVKCGVNKPSEIHILSYMTIKSSSSVGTKDSIEQGRCLRECYIEELIELIGLHMENYFACLKKTGGFEAVRQTDSDDIMKMISSTNIASVCESYYIAARDALDNFYRVLELVYDKRNEDDKRLEKINKLRSRVYESRQIVQRANDREMQRYDNAGKFMTPQAKSQQFQPQLKQVRVGESPKFNPNFRRS